MHGDFDSAYFHILMILSIFGGIRSASIDSGVPDTLPLEGTHDPSILWVSKFQLTYPRWNIRKLITKLAKSQGCESDGSGNKPLIS